jgi:hypothetical protein
VLFTNKPINRFYTRLSRCCHHDTKQAKVFPFVGVIHQQTSERYGLFLYTPLLVFFTKKSEDTFFDVVSLVNNTNKGRKGEDTFFDVVLLVNNTNKGSENDSRSQDLEWH